MLDLIRRTIGAALAVVVDVVDEDSSTALETSAECPIAHARVLTKVPLRVTMSFKNFKEARARTSAFDGVHCSPNPPCSRTSLIVTFAGVTEGCSSAWEILMVSECIGNFDDIVIYKS